MVEEKIDEISAIEIEEKIQEGMEQEIKDLIIGQILISKNQYNADFSSLQEEIIKQIIDWIKENNALKTEYIGPKIKKSPDLYQSLTQKLINFLNENYTDENLKKNIPYATTTWVSAIWNHFVNKYMDITL